MRVLTAGDGATKKSQRARSNPGGSGVGGG
jgi:hypothetical protein